MDSLASQSTIENHLLQSMSSPSSKVAEKDRLTSSLHSSSQKKDKKSLHIEASIKLNSTHGHSEARPQTLRHARRFTISSKAGEIDQLSNKEQTSLDLGQDRIPATSLKDNVILVRSKSDNMSITTTSIVEPIHELNLDVVNRYFRYGTSNSTESSPSPHRSIGSNVRYPPSSWKSQSEHGSPQPAPRDRGPLERSDRKMRPSSHRRSVSADISPTMANRSWSSRSPSPTKKQSQSRKKFHYPFPIESKQSHKRQVSAPGAMISQSNTQTEKKSNKPRLFPSPFPNTATQSATDFSPQASPQISPQKRVFGFEDFLSRPKFDAHNTSSRSLPTPSFLTPPQQIYSQTSYYTDCPHTSPPQPRPLDTQPMTVLYKPGLLLFPPIHLENLNDPSQPINPTAISCIWGACPSCDLVYRREHETEILSKYSARISSLETRLYNSYNSSFLHTSESAIKIRDLQDDIADLKGRRDREVVRVWKGLSARWGPGTVGIHRGLDDDYFPFNNPDMGRSSTMSSRTSKFSVRSNTSSSVDGVNREGRMRVEWIRPDRVERNA